MSYQDDIVNVDSILSLMGGTIFHFIVGIKIMWGNITPYVTSYLVQFDPTVTYHKTLHVYTAVFLGQSLFMYLGGQLEKQIGPRMTCYIGAAMISSGTYLSSYCKSISALVVCQGVVGIGIGISYSSPIVNGFKYFKKSKGIVTGVITTGTGAGPFLFGLIATTFVNKENYLVDQTTGLYDPTTSPVVDRVPSMFRLLGTIYAVCGFLGASLLISLSEDENRSELTLAKTEDGENTPINAVTRSLYGEAVVSEKNEATSSSSAFIKGRGHQRYGSRVKFTTTFELTTDQMIRDSLCWLLIATKICTGVSGFFVAATYKSFGVSRISDDHFITVIGCFGCLSSGLSRLLWGATADKIGHFKTLELAAYASPFFMIVYTLTVQIKICYGLSVVILFALWGANYCLLPTIASFLFGDKHMGTNYGFIFLVFGLSCTFIIDVVGASGMSFLALNWVFVFIGFIGARLCSHVRYLTTKVADDKALRHHRATSSVGSMI